MRKNFMVEGIAIVEMIMTLAILGIVICPIMSLFIMSQKINNESDVEYKSMLLAQKYMEEIIVTKDLDFLDYSYNYENGDYEKSIYEDANNLDAEIKIKPDGKNILYNIFISIKKNGQEINSLTGTKIINWQVTSSGG